MKKLGVVLALAALVLGACAEASGRVAIQDAWARPITAGNNSAVYLLITNGAESDDILTGASSAVARAVEIHESMMMGEGDVMQMGPVERLPVAAGESVTFEPGGYHVMLIDLQQDLVLGEDFEVTLVFEQAGEITVPVEVAER